MPRMINLALVAEVGQAVLQVKQDKIPKAQTISEICPFINQVAPSGENWQVLHAYPSDADGIMHILVKLDGVEHILEVEKNMFDR